MPGTPFEQKSWLLNMFATLWQALLHPVIRLNLTLPWDLKQFSRVYFIAFVYYLIGSLIPIALLFGSLILLSGFAHQAALGHLTGAGRAGPQFVLAVTLISFLTGFGAELWYFKKQLRQQGLNVFSALALNLNSLKGSWWEAFKRSAMALGVALVAEAFLDQMPLPRPHQAAADVASHVTGVGLLAFAVLAAMLAPVFEEIIFRGFIFNGLRTVLSRGRLFSLVGSNQRFADWLAVGVSAGIFAGAHLDPTAFWQLFLLGAVLAELYRRSGTLVCPMMLHAMNNILATLVLLRH
jgi:membrane protease YdiL (CAAX protease family)